MGIRPSQLAAMGYGLDGQKLGSTPPEKSKSQQREEEVHDQIEQHLRSRGYYYVHARMDRRTTTAEGTPDFIIALPNGTTLWVEVKVRPNKPSIEQLGAIAHLQKLKHWAKIVWSFEEYLAYEQKVLQFDRAQKFIANVTSA